MKVDIQVPSAGESVTEATVAAIMKDSGTFVNKEEEILELETDKVNQILYAPEGGVLNLTVKVDDVVTPNQVIGFIDTEGKGEEAVPPPPEAKKETPPPSSGEGVRKTPESFVAGLSAPVKTPLPLPLQLKLPPSHPSPGWDRPENG